MSTTSSNGNTQRLRPLLRLRPLSDPARNEARTRAVDMMYERDELRRQYHDAIERALQAHGDGSGVPISGVVRSHFPENVKDELRAMARKLGEMSTESYLIWTKQARCTGATWRRYMAEHNLNL